MVEVAEQNYAKELKKATYYVNEIKETVNFSVKEDVLSAYKKICDVSKPWKLRQILSKTPCWRTKNHSKT